MTSAPQNERGFTLVEMLAAMAVMSILFLFLFQIVNTVSLTGAVSSRAEAASQRVQAVLDSLGSDLANFSTQYGSTVLVQTSPVPGSATALNSELTFITRNRGPLAAETADPTKNPHLFCVDYQINPATKPDGTATSELLRTLTPVAWGTDALKCVLTATTPNANGSYTTIVADSLLRMEVSLLLDNGQIVPIPNSGGPYSYLTQTVEGQAVGKGNALVLTGQSADPANPKVKGLLVSVAALEPSSYALGNSSTLGASLPSATATELPLDLWYNQIKTETLSSFPKPTQQALRFGQKTFLLQ